MDITDVYQIHLSVDASAISLNNKRRRILVLIIEVYYCFLFLSSLLQLNVQRLHHTYLLQCLVGRIWYESKWELYKECTHCVSFSLQLYIYICLWFHVCCKLWSRVHVYMNNEQLGMGQCLNWGFIKYVAGHQASWTLSSRLNPVLFWSLRLCRELLESLGRLGIIKKLYYVGQARARNHEYIWWRTQTPLTVAQTPAASLQGRPGPFFLSKPKYLHCEICVINILLVYTPLPIFHNLES